MLGDLILHSQSRTHLERYLVQPTHAVLLTGTFGVGLGTIAETLARHIAGASVVTIKPTTHAKQKTANINIDDIRSINQLSGRRRTDRLAVVIDDVEKMTNDAPQAFLKLLEEPTENIFYILTAHDASRIPATILSRAQTISIVPPKSADLQPILDRSPIKLTADKVKKINFMASDQPAEMTRLVTDEVYFRNAAESIEKAKRFLLGSAVDRLEIVASTTTRESATELVRDVAKITTLTATQAPNATNLSVKLTTIATTLDNLKQNGNVRTQLLFLALNV